MQAERIRKDYMIYRLKRRCFMKRIWSIVMVACFGVLCASLILPAVAGAEDEPAFTDQKGKISYGIGVGVARDFKNRGVELDVGSFLKGLRDELSGAKLLMTERELDQTMDAYVRDLRVKQEKADMKAAEENKKAGEAFLAENAKKAGVVALPSGLQYKVLKTGKGDGPTDTDAVQINYRGTLINGTEIESSYGKTDLAVVRMTGLIPGLREAFKLMSPGATWQIFVPASLAYGDRKVYRTGPNSTLIFEVELVSVLKSSDPGNAQDGNKGQPKVTGQKTREDVSRGAGSTN
jgi:FKBP-type peptidyl-prolyl cis-trans isomerase